MAAMSAAPTATTLTPPSSSHGADAFSWNTSSGSHVDTYVQNKKASALGEYSNGTSRKPSTSQYDNSDAFSSNHGMGSATTKSGRLDLDYNPKGTVDPAADGIPLSPNTGRPKSELYGANPDSDASKWIHRDKLARIENEELQAAGYILPPSKPRARSKVRREVPGDRSTGHRSQADSHSETRSRKNSIAVSEPKTPEITIPSWDLRLPEEIMTDEPYFATTPGGSRVTSRIPVAKLSPVPIAPEHLERDSPMTRRRDASPEADNRLSYQKPRSRGDSMNGLGIDIAPHGKRSVTDSSPKKNAAGARKGSAPAKTNSGGSVGSRTKTGTWNKEGPSRQPSQSRPTTRSGELSPVASGKQPEGEPPWMVSAYKPDPRLPPDQQLLPTVAKRLQQEKWEREGKFGNIYDKEFRPLTDEGFLKPPEPAPERPSSKDGEKQQEEWPLKTEPKSLALNLGRTGSYSTIPKIQDKPTIISPMHSPRTPVPRPEPSPLMQPQIQQQQQPQEEEEKEKKGGCGCCIVM